MDATAPSVAVTADLDEAIDALPDGPGAPSWLTVLDQNRRVQGILALPDIVRAYHRTLQADARRMAQASSGAPAAVLELTVAPHAPAAERTVADAGLPVGAIVVSIRRSDSVLLGTGTARFTPGDLVTLLVRPDRRDAVTALLAPDRQDP